MNFARCFEILLSFQKGYWPPMSIKQQRRITSRRWRRRGSRLINFVRASRRRHSLDVVRKWLSGASVIECPCCEGRSRGSTSRRKIRSRSRSQSRRLEARCRDAGVGVSASIQGGAATDGPIARFPAAVAGRIAAVSLPPGGPQPDPETSRDSQCTTRRWWQAAATFFFESGLPFRRCHSYDVRSRMKTLRKIVAVGTALAISGCEMINLIPNEYRSRTDVASNRRGAPSAEVSISFFSHVLESEAKGESCPKAWGTYREYWIGRMDYIRSHESQAYYERVFRDFPTARKNLGLPPIPVKPYN